MLGKSGDILSILPCLQAEYRETGIKPTLVVAQEYAALPRALPWLSVEEFPDSFERLGEAIKWAKLRGKVDFVPQLFGVDYPIPVRRNPSFQYCQWERMGRLHQWAELTLELPFSVRKWQAVLKLEQPTILLCDHSQSSPFAPIEDLHSSLVKEFPSHSIVRSSSYRYPLLLDMLTLMDAMDLIVAIDSAPLHLSRACKTPVIALVTDHPSTWHGSGYHPRFALHVRYSDYALRKDEMLWVAKKELTVATQKVNLVTQ